MTEQGALQNQEILKMMKEELKKKKQQKASGFKRKATKVPEEKVWAKNRKKNKQVKKQKQKQRRMNKK